MTSFKHNYHPKSPPPNTIAIEIITLMYGFGEDTSIQCIEMPQYLEWDRDLNQEEGNQGQDEMQWAYLWVSVMRVERRKIRLSNELSDSICMVNLFVIHNLGSISIVVVWCVKSVIIYQALHSWFVPFTLYMLYTSVKALYYKVKILH